MKKEIITRRNLFKAGGAIALYLALEKFGILEAFAQEPEPLAENQVYREFLKSIAATIPDIGGRENYHLPLDYGIGFTSRHTLTIEVCLEQGEKIRRWMTENGIVYEQLTPEQQNVFDITQNGQDSIIACLNTQQSRISPQSCLKSNQYLGLIATRCPEAIGSKYLVYTIDSATLAQAKQLPKFAGVALVIDCPARQDWDKEISDWTYNFLGWQGLPWIADISDGMQEIMPLGWSGDPKTLNEGRPGVLLVSEAIYKEYHDPDLGGSI